MLSLHFLFLSIICHFWAETCGSTPYYTHYCHTIRFYNCRCYTTSFHCAMTDTGDVSFLSTLSCLRTFCQPQTFQVTSDQIKLYTWNHGLQTSRHRQIYMFPLPLKKWWGHNKHQTFQVTFNQMRLYTWNHGLQTSRHGQIYILPPPLQKVVGT